MGWKHDLTLVHVIFLMLSNQKEFHMKSHYHVFFFMVSSHQEISHGIILSVLFFLNIKTISIFIWLTYIYFPNVLQCIFSTSVPSSLIFPLYIFIIKFLAHFNNNYKKTILEIYWEIQGEKWATMKCMKILGLANSPHPWTCVLPVISAIVTWKFLAVALTYASHVNVQGSSVQFDYLCGCKYIKYLDHWIVWVKVKLCHFLFHSSTQPNPKVVVLSKGRAIYSSTGRGFPSLLSTFSED